MKEHTALLARLKKQVRLLRHKEEQSRHKLHLALDKMRELGKVYKSRLSKKMRAMKHQISTTRTSAYAKIAADLERKLMRGIEAKKRAFALALAKIEKKHAAQLTKSVAEKGRRKRMAKKPQAKVEKKR